MKNIINIPSIKILLLPAALTLALLTFGPSPKLASAQTGTTATSQLTPEQKLDKRMAHLKKKLNLTDEQVAKMRDIIRDDRAKLAADRQAVKADAKGTAARKEDRKKLQADRQKKLDRLKDVLTPEQLAKFKAMREEQRDRRQARKAKP